MQTFIINFVDIYVLCVCSCACVHACVFVCFVRLFVWVLRSLLCIPSPRLFVRVLRSYFELFVANRISLEHVFTRIPPKCISDPADSIGVELLPTLVPISKFNVPFYCWVTFHEEESHYIWNIWCSISKQTFSVDFTISYIIYDPRTLQTDGSTPRSDNTLLPFCAAAAPAPSDGRMCCSGAPLVPGTWSVNPRPDGLFPDPTRRWGGCPPAICQTTGPILNPKTAFYSSRLELFEYFFIYFFVKVTDGVTGRVKVHIFDYLSSPASPGKAAVPIRLK